MTVEHGDTPDERKIYSKVGAVLYRIDKANPDVGEERAWIEARTEYVRRARRLWKTMQRHGLDVIEVPVPRAG